MVHTSVRQSDLDVKLRQFFTAALIFSGNFSISSLKTTAERMGDFTTFVLINDFLFAIVLGEYMLGVKDS